MNRIDNYMKNDYDYKFGNKEFEDEELKQKYLERINQLEEEGLESTYRALRNLHETEEIGNKTAVELNAQGEKLRNMDSQLDDINSNLTQTQKNINQIKSVFGGIKNRFFNWSSNDKPPKTLAKSDTFEKSKTVNQSSEQQQQMQAKAEFAKITNSAREKQMGDNLDMMSDSLARINALAKGMSAELDRQNNTLDRLNVKTEYTNERIKKQRSEMEKI